MRNLLIVVLTVVACLVAVPPAEAGPIRTALGWLRDKARSAVSAPVEAVRNRRERVQSRRANRGC